MKVIKNKLLFKTLISATAIVAGIAAIAAPIASLKNQVQTKSHLDQNNDLKRKEEIERNLAFRSQENVNYILNEFFENDDLQSAADAIEDYIFLENQISIQRITEMKLTLSFYNPHRTFNLTDELVTVGVGDGLQYSKTKKRSRDVLLSNLTTNWYWVLQNINYLEFAFNPYKHDAYRKIPKESFLYYPEKSRIEIPTEYKQETKKVIAKTSNLKKGYVYQWVGINDPIDLNGLRYIYTKAQINERLINKLHEVNPKDNHLYVNVDLKENMSNQNIKAVFINQKTNETINLNATSDASGLVSFDLETLGLRDEFIFSKLLNAKNEDISHLLTNYHKLPFVRGDVIYTLKNNLIPENIEVQLKPNEEYTLNTKLVFVPYLEKNNIFKTKDNVIKQVYKVNVESKPDDYYQKKEVFYLQFGDNAIIRLLKFRLGDRILGRLDYDFFVFREPIKDLESISQKIEDSIQKKYKEFYNNQKGETSSELLKGQKESHYWEEANFDVGKRPAWQTFNPLVVEELKKEYDVDLYTLRSVDSNVLVQSIEDKDDEEEEKLKRAAINAPDYAKKFIDPELNVRDNKETPAQKKSRGFLERLLETAYPDEIERLEYRQKQDSEEYQNTYIIPKLKEYARILGQQTTYSPQLASKFDEYVTKETPDNIYADYARFISENWYFVFKNIEKFRFQFMLWFRLPDSVNQFDKTQKATHSYDYLKRIGSKKPWGDYAVTSNVIDELDESDVSKEHNIGENKEYFIVKDKAMINLKYFGEGPNAHLGLRIRPYGIVFQESRLKPSVSIITNVFHLSYIHGDPKYYTIFEEELTNQFGIPAKMLMVWKDSK